VTNICPLGLKRVYRKKVKMLAWFHQFCHSLQRTNTGPAGTIKLSS
jgi:hypothetical protein